MQKNPVYKEIDINEIKAFSIGNAQDYEAVTGVTVILCPGGAQNGLDISGGGPASRESTLSSPTVMERPLNAVVLSGGSTFGLAASDGVLKYLEERGIGYDTGFAIVPLVSQSSIFDLCVGSAKIRPDGTMGYAACVDAENRNGFSGSIGAGTGATVGKFYGMERSMKSGLGVAAIQIGELQIGAVVVVNALGDVYDFETGEELAGMLSEDLKSFSDSEKAITALQQNVNLFTGNTTIGCIITNGKLSRQEAYKVASQARGGYSRAIRPVGTTADGDSIHVMASGEVDANVDVAGTYAARVMAMAIRNAVKNADIKKI